MIVRARFVVTMDGPPIENGAVTTAGDRIVDAGRFPEIRSRYAGQEIVDIGEQALLPGLINAHCHLDYTCLRGKIAPPDSFTDWVRAINAAKAGLGPQDYLESINAGFAEAKQFGTTTIANLTAFPELIPEVGAPVRTWWFAELIDIRDPARAREMVDHAAEALGRARPLSEPEVSTSRPPGAPLQWGLAPHALFTASENLFYLCEQVALERDLLLTTHLAESREEMSMFRDGKGELYEFLKALGRDMSDCGDCTPLEQFVRRHGHARNPVARRAGGASAPDEWIVTHLNELADGDFALLAGLAKKFHVVHCPRSHKYFGHSRFQFEKLRRFGLNICLGTDSLASNDDLSLFAEMRAFQREFPSVAPEDVFKMVTTNPARALRQENRLGKISPGLPADLIAVPCDLATEQDRLFEEILRVSRPVNWMMIGGEAP
jgi:aminodeoxyfutalosine deaminase